MRIEGLKERKKNLIKRATNRVHFQTIHCVRDWHKQRLSLIRKRYKIGFILFCFTLACKIERIKMKHWILKCHLDNQCIVDMQNFTQGCTKFKCALKKIFFFVAFCFFGFFDPLCVCVCTSNTMTNFAQPSIISFVQVETEKQLIF